MYLLKWVPFIFFSPYFLQTYPSVWGASVRITHEVSSFALKYNHKHWLVMEDVQKINKFHKLVQRLVDVLKKYEMKERKIKGTFSFCPFSAGSLFLPHHLLQRLARRDEACWILMSSQHHNEQKFEDSWHIRRGAGLAWHCWGGSVLDWWLPIVAARHRIGGEADGSWWARMPAPPLSWRYHDLAHKPCGGFLKDKWIMQYALLLSIFLRHLSNEIWSIFGHKLRLQGPCLMAGYLQWELREAVVSCMRWDAYL